MQVTKLDDAEARPPPRKGGYCFRLAVPGFVIRYLKRSKVINRRTVVTSTALVVLQAGCCRRCNTIELSAAQKPCRENKKSCLEGPSVDLKTSRMLRNEVVKAEETTGDMRPRYGEAVEMSLACSLLLYSQIKRLHLLTFAIFEN